MPGDGTLLSVPVGVGETIPSYYVTATGWNWQAGLVGYLTTKASGANVVADVDLTHGLPVQPQTGATWAVTGTFWQATQPVSLASVPSHAVTNAGTFAVQESGAALTSLQLIDDAVYATGAALGGSDKGLLALAAVNGSTFGPLTLDANSRLQVVTSSAQTRGATVGGTVYVGVVGGFQDGGTTARALNLDSSGRTAVAGAAAHDAAAAGNPVLLAGCAGTSAPTAVDADGDACRLWVSRTGVLQVGDGGGSVTVDDGAGSLTVDNGGTFAVQEGGAALTSLQLIDNLVLAEDAAAASGDPGVQVLAVRQDSPASSTSADGDYSSLKTDSAGRLWCNVGNTVTVAAHDVTNAGTFAVQASQSGTWNVGTVTTVTTCSTVTTVTTLTGSGVAHDGADSGNPHKVGAKATAALSGATLVAAADRTDLYAGVDGVLITRPHCNLEDVVSGNATNTDGTSTACVAAQAAGVKTYLTTIILANSHATTNCTVDIKDGTTVKLSIPVPANGGAVVNLPVPLPGTAATAWNFDPSAAVTTISCSMVGFKSRV